MTIPARVVQAIRPQASAGVLAGAAVVASVFAATPFLLPDVADRLSLPIGLTGLLSTAQVGSFAIAAFLAGRLLKPGRRYHYAGLLVLVFSSFVSAFAPSFALLLGARFLAGLGLGTLTWIAWADATRFPRGLGDVAAVGPVAAAVSSPVLGWLVEAGGYPWVYAALGLSSVAALTLRVDFGELPKIGRRVSSSRSNRLLLAAMTLLTLGGSAVFVFAAATARGVQGLSPVAVSWAFSLNAIAGVAATRFHVRKGMAGLWLTGTAVSALAIGFLESQILFFSVLAVWGFAFWMGVPALFRLLAERSIHPNERVGDAQALMAVGRVAGPIVGGIALGAGNFGRLSLVGAGVMGLAATTVAIVEVIRARG